MIDDTTLDRLLDLIKVDCPPNKSWSVAVRTYALAQRLEINNKPNINKEELHTRAYEKVKQYYQQKGGNN